jgi:hypothetical protein
MGGIAALRLWAEATVALTVNADKKTEAAKISLDTRRMGFDGWKLLETT